MATIQITATGLADDSTALNDLIFKIYNGSTDALIKTTGSHTSDAAVTVTGTTVVITGVDVGALGAGDSVKITAVDDDGTPLTGTLSSAYTITSGDTTAPTMTSATIENAAPTNLVMVFSEVVTGTNLGFTIGGTTSTAFASISGSGTNTITGTMAAAAANGESVTLAYSSATGDVVDLSANALATFTATAVTNSVTVTVTQYKVGFDPATSGRAYTNSVITMGTTSMEVRTKMPVGGFSAVAGDLPINFYNIYWLKIQSATEVHIGSSAGFDKYLISDLAGKDLVMTWTFATAALVVTADGVTVTSTGTAGTKPIKAGSETTSVSIGDNSTGPTVLEFEYLKLYSDGVLIADYLLNEGDNLTNLMDETANSYDLIIFGTPIWTAI